MYLYRGDNLPCSYYLCCPSEQDLGDKPIIRRPQQSRGYDLRGWGRLQVVLSHFGSASCSRWRLGSRYFARKIGALYKSTCPEPPTPVSAQSSSFAPWPPCYSQTLLHSKSLILCNNSRCPRREITLHLQSTLVYKLGVGRSESSVGVCIPQVPERLQQGPCE